MFPIKWIWENMKGYRKHFVTAMCLVVIMALLQLVNPTVSRLIVDKILAPAEGVSPQISLLIPLVADMIGFTLLRTGIGYIMVIYIAGLQNVSPDLIEAIDLLERETKDNTGMTFIFAVNYGARDEITRAVRHMAEDCKAGTDQR